MKVIPCPDHCTFDWKKFHTDLDIATAHLIEESSKEGFLGLAYPSKTSILALLEYASEKAKAMIAKEKN